jgi:hypothetical protein
LVSGLKEGLVECATVCIGLKSWVILTIVSNHIRNERKKKTVRKGKKEKKIFAHGLVIKLRYF